MIDLSLLDNPSENIFILKKWNWDYLEAEKLQLKCVDFVNKNPHITILIICSHPHCFTLGRGLQKIKETTKIDLVDFDHESFVPFPLHQIKRGGGLTFHYPGQVVFYPILNLTTHKKAVFDLMMKIMEITKNLLEEQFDFAGLDINRDLLGLWSAQKFKKTKIASIGLAVSRFNTYHGLAINFFNDEEMFQAISCLHPCGLSGELYQNLELLLNKQISPIEREKFSDQLLKLFLDYLKPQAANQLIVDKQISSSLINNSIS